MKRVIIATLILVLNTGCALTRQVEQVPPAEKRRLSIKGCVKEFLHEDVKPERSFDICNSIYQRWQ